MKISNSNNFYKRTAKFIANSKISQTLLSAIDKNPSLAGSTFAFAVAVFAKPIAIATIPKSNKDDKLDGIYSIARSISTGIADLAMGIAVFIPINKLIDSSGKTLFNSKNTIYHNNKEMCSNFKSIFNRGFKISFLPVFAFAKFFLIDDFADKIAKKSSERENKKLKVDIRA